MPQRLALWPGLAFAELKKNQLLGSCSAVRAARSLQEVRRCSLGFIGIAFVCGSRALWLFGGWLVEQWKEGFAVRQ